MSMKVLIVVGDMRPTAQEVSESDLIIKVPLDHDPQVIYWTGPPREKPVLARSHRKKSAKWTSS